MTLRRAAPEQAGAAVGTLSSMRDAGFLAAGLASGTIAAWPGFRYAYLNRAMAIVAFAIATRVATPERASLR